MDNKLDFYNDLNRYIDTLGEDDAALVITHNPKNGDAILAFYGEWENISVLFSSAPNYVNLDKDSLVTHKKVKELIMNTAYNICYNDAEIKRIFFEKLNEQNK